MEPHQQTLAGVLLGVIVLWITEAVPIPIGGLLGVAVIVLLQVAPADDILAAFGSSTIFTFIGAFILAQAMLKHGLARRFACRILALPWAGRSTYGVIIAFGAITCALSAFVSNTATVAMPTIGRTASSPCAEIDEQHGVGSGGGADRDPGGSGGRHQPVRAGARGHVRRVVRLHASGVDAAKRRGLRLRGRAVIV